MRTPTLPTLMLLALSLVAAGCGDEDMTASPGKTDGATAAADAGAPSGDAMMAPSKAAWTKAEDVKYVVAMPGLVSLGTVHGDAAKGPHATFARVTANKALPSHMHTAAVRAVVVSGPMEIPAPSNETATPSLLTGAYAFVPAKAEHAMKCKSAKDCLFLITQTGGFDMKLSKTPPTGGGMTHPRNKDAKVMTADKLKWADAIPGIVQLATLHGDRMTGAHGSIARVTAGKSMPPHWHTRAVRGYVLKGDVQVPVPYDQANAVTMKPGSYFFVPAKARHAMKCTSTTTCMFYFVQDGAFDFNPLKK